MSFLDWLARWLDANDEALGRFGWLFLFVAVIYFAGSAL